MPAEALPVAFSPAELALADAMGKNIEELTRLLRRCSECDALILDPDNRMWLDAKPLTGDDLDSDPLAFGIMAMGPLLMGCAPAAGEGGSRHRLHAHQPQED